MKMASLQFPRRALSVALMSTPLRIENGAKLRLGGVYLQTGRELQHVEAVGNDRGGRRKIPNHSSHVVGKSSYFEKGGGTR